MGVLKAICTQERAGCRIILTQRTVLFAYALRGSVLSVGVKERKKALRGGGVPLPIGCVALAVRPTSNPESSLLHTLFSRTAGGF